MSNNVNNDITLQTQKKFSFDSVTKSIVNQISIINAFISTKEKFRANFLIYSKKSI